MSQNNSQGQNSADPGAQITDQQLNALANEIQLNGNTSESQLRDEGASISQTMPLIPANGHYQEDSLSPTQNGTSGQNAQLGKKDKVVLPPIANAPSMINKSMPHSDRQGQTLVPDDAEENLRGYDRSGRLNAQRTSISAHDVTKTHQMDPIEGEDPILAQERLDAIQAEKTLQTVVGMFGNQDHTAIKKAKLDAKKKEAQKDILGLPRQEKDGYAFSFRVNGQKKFAVYDKASCMCCKAEFFLRKKVVYIFCHPAFDNFIILMIFINSMALACYNYDDRDNTTDFNKQLEKLGLLFSIVFTIEAIIKITAMGFVVHKNSYLRDYWNWLDFLVVCIGFIELFPIIPAADLKSLRTLRVLRPLKSINAFPSMRRLIGSLLASLPSLANAVVFMLFIFLLFGILGVQQFKGVFYQRCRTTPYPINDTVTGLATHWPIDEDVERLCTIDGSGAYSCPKNKEPGNEGLEFCGSIRPDWPSIPFESEGTINQELIMYGIIHFDNLITGIIAIFQMITLEGWTTIMYNIGDATQTWMAISFCVLLVIVGSFFLLNVVLAVIMDAFDDVDKNHALEEERQAKEIQALKELYEILDTDEELPDDLKNEELLIIDQDPLKDEGSVSLAPLSVKQENQIKPIEIQEESKDEQNQNASPSKKKRHSKDEPMPERALKNVVYRFFYLVCTHDAFTVSLTSCIVINTVLLALDRFPISKSDTNELEFYNNILSWIFIIEMFIKMIGLGLKDYVADSFNIFDCSVVMISIVEQIIGWIGVNMGSGGAISALRAIRLLRVFKLARSWTSFRELLQKMIITLKDIRNFSVLMLIFMFIFTLLGMEMYAYRVLYVDDDLSAAASSEEKEKKIGSYPRANFNQPWNGIITVFIVLIGEDWNSSLYDHYRSEGYVAHFYFITLFILGNLILLNLFLAILLKNFEEPPGKDEEEEDDDGKPKIPITQKIKAVLCFCCKKREAANQVNVLGDAESPGRNSNNRVEIELKGNTSRSGLDESNLNNKIEKTLIPGQVLRNSTQVMKSEQNNDFSGPHSPLIRDRKDAPIEGYNTEQKDVKLDEHQHGDNKLTSKKKSLWMTESEASPNKNRKKEMKKQNLARGQDSKKFSMVSIKQQAALASQKKTKKIIKLEGRALGLFSTENNFRIICKNLVQHENFDNVILFLIAFSTILLTLETPDMNPKGQLAYVLKNIDYVVSAVFLMELIIKNIVYGYIVNGSGSYMRDAWNILDFTIVCISIISIVLQDVDLGILKVLRMARVLRPLRVISRNPGLRIAVMSLINAIPNIGNVMVVSILFLLLFAILGTNLYKGYFFYCETENVPGVFADKIIDKFDCMDYGGDWVNKDQNFDNVGASFITLFNVMTTEGWIGVMWDAVDANVINEMPKQGKSPSQALFFILFMIFGSLFILNMFVGIVINVFNNEKEALQMNHYLTPTQDDWCECMILCYKTSPQSEFQPTGNKLKDYSHAVASHKLFESGIFMCILINTICLALTWYDEPVQVAAIIAPINLAFNIIYTIEAAIKLVAFGKNYFNDGWNKFDFTIVIVAWIGQILNNVGLNIGASTTVIRSFRISRVFKIIRKYKNLRILFNTFIDAFPQLTNVGALLFLIIFVYSVLGMQIFGKVKLQGALTVHANFQSFTTALITLFRMATGESWHEIMFDCGRQKSVTFDCYESITYEQIAAEGILGCGSQPHANIYFISFMVIVSFVFLQLFIAIILESFNTSSDEEGLKVKQETLDKFNHLWTKMFPDGDLYMDVTLLPQLIDQLLEEEIRQIYEINLEVQDGDIDIYEYQKLIFLFNLHKDDDLNELASYKKDKVWKEKEEEKGMVFDESVATIESVSLSEDGGGFINNMNKRSAAEHAKIKEKKKHRKLLNGFIAELEIPCYFISGKKSKKATLHYYYYDILEGLSRNLFLNLLLESRDELVEREAAEQNDSEPNSPTSNLAITNKDSSPQKDAEPKEWQFDPEDVEKEYYDGIKMGDIGFILQGLEDKGKNHDIQKFKEMQSLRQQRNKSVLDKLANSTCCDSVIDSSQIASAMVLMKAMKKHRAKIIAKKRLDPILKLKQRGENAVNSKNSVNIGFQQNKDDENATMMKTTNNMHQIRETENEDQDYDQSRQRVKKMTSGGSKTTKQLVTEDGILRSSPSVDQVKRSDNQLVNMEDCVPGNKQGEEVFQVKSSAVAEEGKVVDFTDARAVGNNVANTSTSRPKKKKRNIVSSASNPQQSLSQQSSDHGNAREYNFQTAEQLELDQNDQPDKESLKDIVSPMSQHEQEVDFNVTTEDAQDNMFQKIDKQDRMNNTQQNFKFQKTQDGEQLQDVEEDGQN